MAHDVHTRIIVKYTCKDGSNTAGNCFLSMADENLRITRYFWESYSNRIVNFLILKSETPRDFNY